MFSKIKKSLYFPLSYYFRFFAKIRLSKWKPYIIVVTGSSGKTTLLHLIQSQIGDKAKYSHHANSAYGIPFDILGLHRKTLEISEWINIFVSAPFSLFKTPPKEKLYVVEADCDRPGEGKFLATLLKPNITLWTNSTKTHSMNFDELVRNGKFAEVEEAIAHEFGYFLKFTKDYAVINGDSENAVAQIKRSNSPVHKIYINDLKSYKITKSSTIFEGKRGAYKFDFLLPKEFFYSLQFTIITLKTIGEKLDLSFKNFTLPPGRNSVFRGIKNTTLIDSAYNANFDSMSAILNMYDEIEAENKWLILGDMLEQGKSEKEEHEKLAKTIQKIKFEKLILLGPRVSKYTYPLLEKMDSKIVKFINPDEVLGYLRENLKDGEVILFKGARFLEGVIENLLLDKNDAKKLARREKIWEKRRKKFGL